MVTIVWRDKATNVVFTTSRPASETLQGRIAAGKILGWLYIRRVLN